MFKKTHRGALRTRAERGRAWLRSVYMLIAAIFAITILAVDASAEEMPVVEAEIAAATEVQDSADTQESLESGKIAAEDLAIQQLREERLDAKRREISERRRAKQREQAQEAAIKQAREELKRRVKREEDAQRQIELARDRQLKLLYSKGRALYRQGAYDEAIDALEQVAVVEPGHALVKAAEELIARAELKKFEQRLRASTEVPAGVKGAVVPELEELLAHKRMEMDVVFNYAKEAAEERRHDIALKLLTGILVQDPSHRGAKNLLEKVHMAKLSNQRKDIIKQIEEDEYTMINNVLRAQVLPDLSGTTVLGSSLLTQIPQGVMSAKLREPISFEFNDVGLGDVLEFISDAANVSLVPSPQLDLKTERVTMKIKELPLDQAIKYLTKSLSLAYRIEDNAILIASPDEFSNAPVQTRVFLLRRGLGPYALESAALIPDPAFAAQSIWELIQETIPQPSGSNMVVDERSGALVVTNTPDNLILVESLLSQLDVAPVQVLIEARFVEITVTDLEHMGLEAVLTSNSALTKRGVGDNTEDAGHEVASGSGFTFPSLSRESEALNITLEGVLTGAQFETVLHMLEESSKSKTLSAPRVTTLNNQRALIRVVDEFRYPTRYEVSLVQFDINGDGDFDDANETEFANVPQDFEEREIGILLNVIPSVGKNLKTITLVLMPEVSSFSQFRDLGGGVIVPEFTSSRLATSVIIEDGQTAVLGGLMKDTTSETVTKVPFLGDLPLLGSLFRQTEESSTRKNLLIFITARVLAPRGETI